MPDDSHNKWFGIGRYLLSFLAGVIVAAFTLGSAGQKVRDLVAWKAMIGPKIERMDSVGSLSFDHFHKSYEKEQARINERLQQLEKDVKDLEKRVDP
jgi:hypothetical protein